MSAYETGVDMWHGYKETHGDAKARTICNDYLDMQGRNDNPEELAFCRELYAAMQSDPPEQVQPVQRPTFEYRGYHFMPERRFRPREGDFHTIMQRASTDFELGLSTYGWRKADYSYESFYAVSTDKTCDLFRCVETGRLYFPGENELFAYQEPRQRERSPGARPSALAALEQAKEAAATAPRTAKPKSRGKPEL